MRRIGTAAALLFLLATAAFAAAAEKGEDFAKGFRDIPWGTSLQEVRKRFPDLVQETYGAGGEADHHVRDRSAEDPKIEGMRFDRIEYHFRDGAFVGIVATIRTRAEGMTFDALREKIAARSGKPDEADGYRAVWREGKATVELTRRMNSVWLRVSREAEAPPKGR